MSPDGALASASDAAASPRAATAVAAPIAAAVPLNGTSNSSAQLSRCGCSGDAIDCEHNVATVGERVVQNFLNFFEFLCIL